MKVDDVRLLMYHVHEPIGIILEPASFDELLRDILDNYRDFLCYPGELPCQNPDAPFEFMGFRFERK